MSRENDQVIGGGFTHGEKPISSSVEQQEKVAGGSLVGGMLAAVGASLCCVGPLVLVTLGIGGAWIGSLTALEPFRLIFLGIAILFLVLAYRGIYRAPTVEACAPGAVCALPRINRIYKILFWAVAGLISLAGASPYLAPLFY